MALYAFTVLTGPNLHLSATALTFLLEGWAKIMLFLGKSSIFGTNVTSDALKIVGVTGQLQKDN